MSFLSALNTANIPFSTDVSCKTLSTFKIGGLADTVIDPPDSDALIDALRITKQHGIKHTVIGCGSNLLFADDGYRGAIIRIKPPFSGCELTDPTSVRVFAGERLSRLCTFVAQNSLSGIEFAYGIPGSLGGAVYMNAGAYGGEMADVVTSVSVLTSDLTLKTLSAKEMGFAYRHTALCESDDIILSADLALHHGNRGDITALMDKNISARNEKQPLNLPSAGSTFKRPLGGYASALIDECGLKGRSVGGAMVSEKHAGFVVNTGDATCDDILLLCDIIKDTILREKNISLELEVKVIK